MAFSVRLLLAAVFGGAFSLSFAPSEAWWFAPFCLAGLFLIIEQVSAGAAFSLGLSFGAGWFGVGFWWMTPGLNNYSNGGPLVSLLLTIALVTYLSVYPACACALYRRLDTLALQPRLRCAVLAALWTLAEWLRGQLFGGVPWLTTGYAQIAGPLRGYAPVIGVFGITFITAWLAAEISKWLSLCESRNLPRQQLLFMPFLAGLILLSGAWLCAIDWTHPDGQTLTVRLLQGNLPQHDKFTREGFENALWTYEAMTEASTANLTVLPETALPVEWFALPPAVLQRWQNLATDRRTVILLGAVVATAPRSERVTNSAVALWPDGEMSRPGFSYRYDKVNLIPIGETMPTGLNWLGDRLKLDFATFVRGASDQPPLRLPAGGVAVGICFENLFDTAVADKAMGAGLLLNISNFAWFTRTRASAQHLQAGQMRALETGRWFLQAANTGFTAAVDAHGVIHAKLPLEDAGVLDIHVPMYVGDTPFMRARNRPLMLLVVALIGVASRNRFRAAGAS